MAGHRRHWREYETEAGNRLVKRFLDGLDDEDAASVAAAMKEVRDDGLTAACHLQGETYEVRADGNSAK